MFYRDGVRLNMLGTATAAIINTNPSRVQLWRKQQQSDGSGGVIYGPAARAEVILCRIAEAKTKPVEVIAEGGKVPERLVNVTALWHVDLRKGDLFTHNGLVFEVGPVRVAKINGEPYKRSAQAKEVNERLS